MEILDSSVLSYSGRVLRKHLTTNLMTLFFLKPRERKMFAVAYSYFRWLDDQVDDSDLDIEEQEILIKRAYFIIKNRKVVNPDLPERGLSMIIDYAERNNLLFRIPFEQMTYTIERDCNRAWKIPADEELTTLRKYRILGYLNALRICMKVPLLPEDKLPNHGIACDEVHILRDFHEDFKRGIYNFSQREKDDYNLDIENINHLSWKRWFKEKHKQAGKYIIKGYIELLREPLRYSCIAMFNLTRYFLCWLKIKMKWKLW
jgi:hypothetical protein